MTVSEFSKIVEELREVGWKVNLKHIKRKYILELTKGNEEIRRKFNKFENVYLVLKTLYDKEVLKIWF